jgi:hypothetical protein
VGTAAKETLPDPSQTNETDPEILPKAGVTTDKVSTPEGDAAYASEEGEGDNISGNKELRDEVEHKDENNSTRLKVPLHTPTAE